MRSAHGAAALQRSEDQIARRAGLSSRRLAMDAERRQNLLYGLAPGIRFPRRPLGAFLRAHDDLPARDRLTHTPRQRGVLEQLDTSSHPLQGVQLYQRQ